MYSNVGEVQDELNVALTPAQKIHVARLIAEADELIDLETGHAWGASSPATEVISYNGGTLVRLVHRPVLAVSEIVVQPIGDPVARDHVYGSWIPYALTSNVWRVVDGARGEVSVPDLVDPKLASFRLTITYTHEGTTPPALVSRVSRVQAARWMEPILADVTSDVRSYQIGPALSVTRYDRPSNPKAMQRLDTDLAGLLFDLAGSWIA